VKIFELGIIETTFKQEVTELTEIENSVVSVHSCKKFYARKMKLVK